jgi:hypothetical protein
VSLTCCSVISLLRWRYVYLYIYSDSQQSIFVPSLYCCSGFNVLSTVTYSCLLFNIRTAYVDVGLLVLIYRICSLCLIVIDPPDCPMYNLVHALHLSSYIPL